MEELLPNEWSGPRHVDTEGHCFLCLIKLEPGSSLDLNSRQPFQYLCSYLKVDVDKVYTDKEEEDPLCSGNGGSASKLITVSLCEGCAPISDKFSELYKQLERIRMELISYLGVIQGKMIRAEETGLAELFRKSKRKKRRRGDRDNLKIVDELRRETIEKGSYKLSIFQPTVDVQKLTEIEEQNSARQIDSPIRGIKTGDNEFDREMLIDPDYLPEEENDENFDAPSTPKYLPPTLESEESQVWKSDIPVIPPISRRPRTKINLKKDPLVTCNSRLNYKTGKRKCNHCSLEFLFASAFLVHYNDRHLQLRHECSLCELVFATKGNLSRHHRKAHIGVRYGCDTCNKIFAYKSNLRHHQNLKNCSLGGKGFRKQGKLKKTDNVKMEAPDQDANNDASQKRASDDEDAEVLEENVKQNRRRRPVEVVVGADGIKSYTRKMPPKPTIVLEVNGTPQSGIISEAGKHVCSVCSQEFKNLQVLHDHYKADHPNQYEHQCMNISFDCSVCGNKFAQMSNYLRHHRNVHMGVRYGCATCKRLFSLKANLRKHQTLNNCSLKGRGYRKVKPRKNQKTSNKTTTECSDAESENGSESPSSPLPEGVVVKKVKRKKKYQRQPVEVIVGAAGVKRTATILPPNIIQEEEGIPHSGINAESGKHECGLCSREFKELNVLHEHYKAIHLKRRFECTICEKQFSYRQVYNSHYHKVHIVASYKCHICNESFTRKTKLREHQRETSCGAMASTNSKFQCHECGKEFARSIQLKRHVDYVHLKLRENICDQCGKGFATNGHLKKHLMTVHSVKFDNKGPFECEYCKKQFPIIDYLRLHLRVHTGERPYVCEHCGKTFAARSNYNRHREMHSQEGHHQCSQCKRLFPDQPKLAEHQERTGHGLN